MLEELKDIVESDIKCDEYEGLDWEEDGFMGKDIDNYYVESTIRGIVVIFKKDEYGKGGLYIDKVDLSEMSGNYYYGLKSIECSKERKIEWDKIMSEDKLSIQYFVSNQYNLIWYDGEDIDWWDS